MEKLILVPLKFAEFSAIDRELWEKARQPAGPFDEGGQAAAWSFSTCRHVEQGYGTFLVWLEQTDQFDVNAFPVDRVSKDRLRAFLDAYAPGRSPLTVATIVKGIACYYRAISPPSGLPWLTKLAHRMMNTATPSRPKLSRMASIAELIGLGQSLMAKGLEELGDGKVSGAQVYRDGLIIAALAARPTLRLRNLCALRIGHSFLPDKTSVRVTFSGKETKKGNRLDFFYPDRLSKPFDIYLADIRPVLLKPYVKDDGWLWIGRRGKRLPANNITSSVTNATKRHLNRTLPPHLVRDCAATDIALLDPAHVGITKDVLGHKTLASSQRFYNQAASYSALRRLEGTLSKFVDE